jgi:hypothetical protein
VLLFLYFSRRIRLLFAQLEGLRGVCHYSPPVAYRYRIGLG